ncbi:YhdP family protein [Thalassotalea sp. ND16A]|uniref:YhdP family protein n=1 Tax=Thalassotalea sp. ND16A TaxID=1535422 RepID=UPI00051A2173|nr:YhdP family protein [Thalassotalea sp. ND16A]KGJ98952.1 hypothetical protein ND16A_0474 [Thalassotalea sp. ND16A]
MKTFWGYLNRWLNRLYKTLAVLLVLFAVLLTSARVFLPYADTFTTDLEDYINETYQGEVEIGHLSAAWKRFGPTLIIKDVILSDSAAFFVEIDEIDIGIDFWGSIKTQKLKSNNLTLIGGEVTIDRTLFKSSASIESETETDIDALSELLLQQVNRFSVVGSKIIFKHPTREHVAIINKLAWHNEDNIHKGIGKVEIAGVSTNSAKLVVELTGENRKDLQGQVYLEGRNINLSAWLERYFAEKSEQFNSTINFQSWLEIDQGIATEMHLSLGENVFSWDSNEQQHFLKIPAGDISLYRQQNGQDFIMQSSNIPISFNDTPWANLQVQGTANAGEVVTNISGVSLDNLWQLFPVISDNFPALDKYSDLQISGAVNNIQMRKTAKDVQVKLLLDDLGWQASNGIPGIEHVSGELLFNKDKIQLDIDAHDSALDFADGFSRPIPFNQLTARTELNWGEAGWKLAVSDIQLLSDELSISADVQFSQQEQQGGVLSLFAYVHDGDASKVQYYLPLPVMSESLVDYLTGAIFHGDVKQAAVVFNGPVATFPFLDSSGIFMVDADITQAKYRFVDTWPAIEQAQLNLNFTNDSMLITAYDGDLMGTATQGVVVGIESLSGDSILTVRAPVATQAEAIHQLMLASPMAGSVGATLDVLGPQGFISGTFALDVPLSDTDNTVARGLINLNDNLIKLSAPEMEFSKVAGQLSFTNEVISTENLTLDWRGMPMALNVEGQVEDDYYQLNIELLANWQQAAYRPQIPQPLHSYLNGVVDWQGRLALAIPQDGEFSYQLDIASSLEQAELALPDPYMKAYGDKQNLSANVKGGSSKSTIKAKLGDMLSFYGDLDHQKVTFERAQLTLGDEKMLLPMKGFHITTGLDSIVYQQWHELIFDIVDSLPDSTGDSEGNNEDTAGVALLQVPERIRGDVNEIDFFGQTITDVDFNLLNQDQWWLLQLNGEQVRSRIKFYHDFVEQGLEIDADYINFTNTEQTTDGANTSDNEQSSVAASSDTAVIGPAEIPRIRFSCDSCRYQQLDLGKVKFDLENTSNELLSLKSFTARRKGSEVDLSGSWKKDSTVDITSLSGSLNTKDIEAEIAAFGIESGIKDSGMKSSFNFNWQGGPQQFNLSTLNGKFKGKLDDGYLADVSDQGARLLSLFSLQSLVRKLTLDFRDIFSKGMFYDDFKGTFNVANGIVYTDNLKMNGAAGNLTIKGNTDLTTNQLDYKMAFAPKVTSSLPVIAAWVVNPIIGVIILAGDQVIEKAEVFSVINFELTGSTAEPNLKEVDRKSRNVNVGKSKPDQAQPEQKPEPELKPETGPKSESTE